MGEITWMMETLASLLILPQWMWKKGKRVGVPSLVPTVERSLHADIIGDVIELPGAEDDILPGQYCFEYSLRTDMTVERNEWVPLRRAKEMLVSQIMVHDQQSRAKGLVDEIFLLPLNLSQLVSLDALWRSICCRLRVGQYQWPGR